MLEPKSPPPLAPVRPRGGVLIRALPGLSPRDIGRAGTNAVLASRPKPFPLGERGVQLLYLGRNAVWRALAGLGATRATVLMPAYHHGVEVEAALATGAQVRFYRIDSRMQPDLEDVRRLLRQDPRPQALYVTHFVGYPQPLDELRALAREAQVPLIEDCALALFSADRQGRPLGSRGDAAIFCFYKVLPVPDGGALWQPAGPLHEVPLRAPPWGSMIAQAGSNLLDWCSGAGYPRLADAGRAAVRLTKRAFDVRSALGEAAVGTNHLNAADLDLAVSPLARALVQGVDVGAASAIVERRRQNFERVARALGDLSLLALPPPPPGTSPLFLPVLVRDGASKDALIAGLAARGVEAINFWRVGHPLAARGEFPEVDRLRECVVEVPIHQDLDEPQIRQVAAALKESLARR